MFTSVRHYRRDWLPADLVAGLVLAAFLVPTGMGYAAASGLPVQYGLYASIAAPLAYFVVGPSRILVLGPDSALAPLVAAAVAVAPVADRPPRAALLAILAGMLCLLAAVLRLGILTDLISKPVRLGYLNGIALTVAVGQLPAFVGMTAWNPADDRSLVGELSSAVNRLAAGDVSPPALAIGLGCLVTIVMLRRWLPRVPGVLLAVCGAAAVVVVLRQRGLPVPDLVPAVPRGLPVASIPWCDWPTFVQLAPVAAAIAVVAAADTSVLSRSFPEPGDEPPPPNRELAALGVANLVAGLFQGFPVSSSSTRTPIVATAGGRTQLAGLVAAGGVAGMIALAPHVTALIPEAALAAVVIAACGALLDVAGLARLARVRPEEFAVSVVCLGGVVSLGVLPGILLAVAVSLAEFVWRSWRPHDAVLGRVAGIKGYHDVARHPEARCIPGLVIFRWDSPLFFANAGIFRRRLRGIVAASATPVREVLLAAEPITDIDTTASEVLCQLADELRGRGITIAFAELKGPVKDRLRRYGTYGRFGDDAFHPTLGKAVAAYLHRHDVEWRDWTD